MEAPLVNRGEPASLPPPEPLVQSAPRERLLRVSKPRTRTMVAAPTVSAFPDIPDEINLAIPWSGLDSPYDYTGPQFGSEYLYWPEIPEVPEFSPLDLGNSFSLQELPTNSLPSDIQQRQENSLLMLRAEDNGANNKYKITVEQQLTAAHDAVPPGYLDTPGYLVEWISATNDHGQVEISANAKGEGTYFIAIAVIALTSGNYNPDSLNAQDANNQIGKFLTTIESESWGNTDSSGQSHPIRHPEWMEYYGNGEMRKRPMSKDSFNQIVLACYYAYKCPHSSSTVRQQAQTLLRKFISYLTDHHWLLHSDYIANEFDTSKIKDDNGKTKTVFANLFADKDRKERITAFGAETYVLWPHELWALRNCAIGIGVPHETIKPEVNTWNALGEAFIQPLVRQSGDAIDWLYDRLQYTRTYDVQLVPGWRDNRVRGSFSFGAFGIASKGDVRKVFEESVRAQIDMGISLSGKFDGILDKAIAPLHKLLYLPSLESYLNEAVSSLVPWLDPAVFAEAVECALALQGAKITYDPANSGYAFWSFLMEIEARPVLRTMLEPLFRDFFGFLAKNENPNGLWAWLARRHDVVADQISLFESQIDGVNHWTGYAYGENTFNDWIKATADKAPDRTCSRVDYLVLKNLAEKGLPEMPPTVVSFDKFIKIAEKELQQFLENMLISFAGLGYIRRFTDALSNEVEEHFSAERVETTIHSVDGTVRNAVIHFSGEVETFISRQNPAFTETRKFAKVAEDGLLDIDDLLEASIQGVSGELERWSWGAGKVFRRYVQYAGTLESGAVSEALRTILIVRDVSGEISQWLHSSGVLQSFTKWGSSTLDGFATGEQRLEQKIRHDIGELFTWGFHPGGALKEYSRWAKSTIDGAAESADQVEHVLRDVAGQLDAVYWADGVFRRSLSWAGSSFGGIAAARNCVLFQIRQSIGALEQWQLDQGEIRKYAKWAKSTEQGAALAVDNILQVEQQGEKIVRHIFKEGIAVSSQVLDNAGNVISSVGNALANAWDSISHWHL